MARNIMFPDNITTGKVVGFKWSERQLVLDILLDDESKVTAIYLGTTAAKRKKAAKEPRA
jgi:hypothetical protein